MASPEGDIPLLHAFAGDNPKSYGFRMFSEKKPASAQALTRNIEALRGKYRIIDPYQPGTSGTKPLGNISYNTMADEVAAFQKAVGMESSIVFGSSAGGILGIKLAARHPETVKTLVLQGTPTKKEDLQKGPYYLSKALTFGPIPYILFSLHLAYPIFTIQAKTSKEFGWSSKESQKAMLEAFRTGDGKTATKLLREITGKNIEEDIAKVGCPVIVVDGVNGQLVPFIKEKEAAGKFPTQVLTYVGEVVRTRKVKGVLLAVSEAFGKQGHTVVNTSPEVLAVLTDKMSSKLVELTHANENSQPTTGVEYQ
ncbi:alpha/beta hydrolase [Candidatus Roizmanbacteria bacterium]|nr:alpha/beta hydrolase [Candidatus Roizmanbacteria bacterium]